MEFKRDELREIYDVSLVQLNPENPKITAIKSIGKSIFNNIVVILSKIILTTNLILLGHIFYENKVHYELFITYQIGVFILEVFGKYFLIGIIKYLLEEEDNNNDLYNLYIRMKTSIVILGPIIIGLVSISSYFIMELLLENNLEIYNQSINKEVYFKFLLFTPSIYLFEILFLLNLQFLYEQKLNKEVFFYAFSFIICHIILSFLLLYILEIGIIGLTISYGLNTFLFYLFSSRYIEKIGEGTIQNFFLFIPNKENFDGEVYKVFKRKSFLSLINLTEIFIIHFLFFVSLFTDKRQLIVNIIYLNFYELIFSLNRGLYYNLKKYISTNIEAAEKRQEYVVSFSSYYMILGLSLFIILIIFKNILLHCYIFHGGEKILILTSNKLRVIFPLCILLNSIRMLFNGILRGMNKPFPLVKKLLYIIICMSLCYVFCFYYQYGIYGLWISTFIMNLLFVFESIYKATIYFPQFFHNYI